MASLYFGGSFNPIHFGHLICSRAVAEARGMQKIVLVPNSLPPHKANAANMAPPQHRFRMCELAVSNDPLFAVDGLELGRIGPSYTFDTVVQLKTREPVVWLLGADMLLDLPNWHRIHELLQIVQFLVMARPGWSIDWTTLPVNIRPLRNHVVESPLVGITSTDIRSRVRAGQSIRYLTAPAVARYIRQNGLYSQSSR